MKILFGIKALNVPGGGAERVLTLIASGLADRGHDVTVLSFDAPGGRSFYPLGEAVGRICLGIGPTSTRTGSRSFLQRIPALRKTVRSETPDVVVGFMHSMFVPLAVSMAGSGIPLVASEHTVPAYYKHRRLQYALFFMGCIGSTRVTVLSEAIRRAYPWFLRKRMVSMPNPVEVGDVRTDTVGAADRKRVLLAVGRMDEAKDHATLIRAFASLADRFPDWNLRIVGDGVLRGELEKLVSALDITDRVTMPGATAEIEDEYARAQLLAVASRVESFGMVTAEALAAGLPVVGFADCLGNGELITHGMNGWLVAGHTGNRIQNLANGLAEMMADDSLRSRVGAAGPESVRGFGRDVVVPQWEDLLAEVNAARKQRNSRL